MEDSIGMPNIQVWDCRGGYLVLRWGWDSESEMMVPHRHVFTSATGVADFIRMQLIQSQSEAREYDEQTPVEVDRG